MHDIAFSYFLGIGPVIYDKLIQYFGTSAKAYSASQRKLAEILGEKRAVKFVQFRDQFDVKKEQERLFSQGITIVSRLDKKFPDQLRNIPDVPICLYVKGTLESYNFESDFFFGIVGTRKPTSYGIQIAHKFAYDLSNEGLVIVSGMAMGIDSIAHEGALDAGGRTIAFLGCGVNIIYPPSNTQLYERILANHGLIISEFPPDMTVQPGLFISRNRLISGLSKGILVAEGMKDSGSLITARFAAEQGKEVFAPPGPITSEQSEAPNILIKEGARLVTSPNDILDEFHMKTHQIMQKKAISLEKDEEVIYELLKQESYSCDELIRKTNIPIQIILKILSGLELKGIIERSDDGTYQLIY